MATYNNVDRGSDRFRRKRNDRGGRRPEKEKEGQLKTSNAYLDANSAVVEAFKHYQLELDLRNDCHERIVKLSRDITIESKRIIFLLHRATGSEERSSILTEAAARMLELRTTKFLPLAQELDGQDPYQFLRAYSPGLQEYIEAVTFYHYLANNQLASLDSIKAELTFVVQSSPDNQCTGTSEKAVLKILTETSMEVNEASLSKEEDTQVRCADSQQSEKLSSSADMLDVPNKPIHLDCENIRTIWVPVPPTEYMMGVADFSGELMRMAINSVGCGDLKLPTIVAEMMRMMHDAFASFGNIPRELRQKIRVLRQSLQKVETACYAMKVRGSEKPAHVLIDVFTSVSSGIGDMFSMDDAEDFCE